MRDRLTRLYDAFDPTTPATDEQRVERQYFRLSRLIAAFRKSANTQPKVLLAGSTGTGKTTELRGFAEAMRTDHCVLFVDLVHLYHRIGDTEALRRIQPWEVVFQVGIAATLQLREDREWHAEQLLAAFRSLATPVSAAEGLPEVDVGRLLDTASTLVSVATANAPLGIIGKLAGSVRWLLPLGTGGAVPDQDQRIRTLVDAANSALGALQRTTRTVVVVDGLDRVEAIERSLELFVHSSLFGRMEVPLVVTAPFILRHHLALASIETFKTHVLLNEPVLKHHLPAEAGPGVGFFRDVFNRRGVEGDLIDDEDLQRLARASGGRARDFVKLVREAVDEALLDGAERIGARHVEAAIASQRAILEVGVHDGHREVLLQVMETTRLPRSDLTQELLLYRRLLPFPNESEWYYPHPLLIPMLTRPD